MAQVKKEQFAKDHDFFDICDRDSSELFDKREKLIKRYPKLRKMRFEYVEKFLKQSTSSNPKKSGSKATTKVSKPKVEKVVQSKMFIINKLF